MPVLGWVLLAVLVLIAISAVVIVGGLIWGVSTSYDGRGKNKKRKKAKSGGKRFDR